MKVDYVAQLMNFDILLNYRWQTNNTILAVPGPHGHSNNGAELGGHFGVVFSLHGSYLKQLT